MTTKRMKSDEARINWRDVMDYVQAGGSVIVERWNKTVARVIPENDTLVVLRVSSANQAERLRQLVREHGSLGIPFPNNAHPDWTVTNGQGNPVNVHAIPSVGVQIVTDDEEPAVTTTYTAAIGLVSGVVAGDRCDVSVIENDAEGNMSMTVAMDAIELDVRTDDEDVSGKVYQAADDELSNQGWRRTGDWDDAAGDAAYAPVERA
jgi:antitoxin (DNA-binding transcriptional repressor) of toxin-antitoxin stability system